MQEDTILDANSNHAPFYHWYHRMLAEKRLYIDYSVLSVGVMTLGLILMVEVLRHRIDHAAVGRPFFKAVLEGVYSECESSVLHMYCSCSLALLLAEELILGRFIRPEVLVSTNKY